MLNHFFRSEYRNIVAVLARRFGFAHIEIAEDIASDTFLTAAQTWPIEGIPPNPVAWLHRVARNKATNYLQRDALFQNKISGEIKRGADQSFTLDLDLSPENISDSQLQMMFAVCHPSIAEEAQIGLALRILCGFGIQEIADAFLTNKEVVNKRLFRAREKLREEQIDIALPPAKEIDQRLQTVLTTIYLLFNEGYYSASQDKTIRKDLCLEAMRLCKLLIEHPQTDQPAVNALMALMCFHVSRFDARENDEGDLVLYDEQDDGLWNQELIANGGYYLHRASMGSKISRYHLEAGIAYWNTHKEDSIEKWKSILRLYDELLKIAYSPIAALNRAYAIHKAGDTRLAIEEADKLSLENHQLHYALMGELYKETDQQKAASHLSRAIALARTQVVKERLQKSLDSLKK